MYRLDPRLCMRVRPGGTKIETRGLGAGLSCTNAERATIGFGGQRFQASWSIAHGGMCVCDCVCVCVRVCTCVA